MKGISDRKVILCVQKRSRRRRRFLLLAFVLTLAALGFVAVKIFEMDAWSALDMDKVLLVDRSLIIKDKDGNEFTTLHDTEDRIWVGIDDIPVNVRNAFIAAEDARFYDHFGIDVVRILGAAWADLKAGAYVQGASTISQQLIKLSHLSSEKQMQRKLEEAILAYQMERAYSKDEILEMYLNYVYFGGGYYGVEAAARGYFGVHAGELSTAQAAQLAGILKSPTRFSPHLNMEASVGRRNVILDLMLEYGYLDGAALARAKAEKCVLNGNTHYERRGSYVDLVLTNACTLLDTDMEKLLSDGYVIETAMDAELQLYAEQTFADDTLFPDGGNEGLEAALAVVDVSTGGVRALIGGRKNEGALTFNRAVGIRRQPGSVIKPILVYAPALEAGYTAASMLLDDEMDFAGYRPSNATGTYAGWVTMREAVTRSLNVPAVSVMAQVGVGRSKAFASRLGIRFDKSDTRLALALGGFTYGVSPMQISAAYAAFARGGSYIQPGLITRITNSSGETLYEAEGEFAQVMSEGNAFILTSMLESAVSEGTGKNLGTLGIPLAGKTGTVGDSVGNRDIWMAAYNPEYAAAVWIGYDDGSRIKASDAAGGTYPAELLKRLFASLYPEGDAPDFRMPEGVIEQRIDQYTLNSEHIAVLASALTPETAAYTEYFCDGTQPTAISGYWALPQPPQELTLKASKKAVKVTFEAPSRLMLYRLYRENSAGKSVLLTEFSDVEGTVIFEDTAIKRTGKYAYYVVPVHPQLTLAGENLTGRASERARIFFKLAS